MGRAVEEVAAELERFVARPDNADSIQQTVMAIIRANIQSAEEATSLYRSRCNEFMKTVRREGGMPFRAVIGADSAMRPKRDLPWDAIRESHRRCVERYGKEAETYLEAQISRVAEALREFLASVPVGSLTAKHNKGKIGPIKKLVRELESWDRVLSTNKTSCFPFAVERDIVLMEANPIAAIWHYNPIDERGQFADMFDHRSMDGRVFTVRSNWALTKGLMAVGADRYVDEIRPGKEWGCMCHLTWITSLRKLPDLMVTAKGRAELARVRALDRGNSIHKSDVF